MDPTRPEMLEFLSSFPFSSESDQSDQEQAIWWYCANWHSGQSSNLYEALSESPWNPGPMEVGCDPDSMAGILYEELVAKYSTRTKTGHLPW